MSPRFCARFSHTAAALGGGAGAAFFAGGGGAAFLGGGGAAALGGGGVGDDASLAPPKRPLCVCVRVCVCVCARARARLRVCARAAKATRNNKTVEHATTRHAERSVIFRSDICEKYLGIATT